MPISRPGTIHRRIVEIMKRFPQGVTSGQIRQELEAEGLRPEDQTHLDRRKRDLRKWFIIETIESTVSVGGKPRNALLYRYAGERADVTDEGEINQRVKSEVLHAAHGRCQMCGKTIAEDKIKLVVDHRKPRAWGGSNDRENLWAICEPCNAGKKAFFSSLNVNAGTMKQVMAHDSVHVRIGEMLKAMGAGVPTPSALLQVAADQDDWHKRLRELRYPVIGWEIETRRHKAANGKVLVDYVLVEYKPWPDDPRGTIRRYEQERERRNRRETINPREIS